MAKSLKLASMGGMHSSGGGKQYVLGSFTAGNDKFWIFAMIKLA
jgi:hypothetical protein